MHKTRIVLSVIQAEQIRINSENAGRCFVYLFIRLLMFFSILRAATVKFVRNIFSCTEINIQPESIRVQTIGKMNLLDKVADEMIWKKNNIVVKLFTVSAWDCALVRRWGSIISSVKQMRKAARCFSISDHVPMHFTTLRDSCCTCVHVYYARALINASWKLPIRPTRR